MKRLFFHLMQFLLIRQRNCIIAPAIKGARLWVTSGVAIAQKLGVPGITGNDIERAIRQ